MVTHLVSSEFCCIVETDTNTLEDAEKSLYLARENLFNALKSHLHKIEGANDLITFYKNRIIDIKKRIEYLR